MQKEEIAKEIAAFQAAVERGEMPQWEAAIRLETQAELLRRSHGPPCAAGYSFADAERRRILEMRREVTYQLTAFGLIPGVPECPPQRQALLDELAIQKIADALFALREYHETEDAAHAACRNAASDIFNAIHKSS